MPKFNFNITLQKLQQQKTALPIALAEATHQYFIKAFDSQSWNGTAWPDVKRHHLPRAKYASQPSLVNTGALRNKLDKSLVKADANGVLFQINGLKYAAIQNDGGVILHDGKVKTAARLGIHLLKQKAGLKDKKFKLRITPIPQRQYMGQTDELTRIQKQIIASAMANAFKK